MTQVNTQGSAVEQYGTFLNQYEEDFVFVNLDEGISTNTGVTTTISGQSLWSLGVNAASYAAGAVSTAVNSVGTYAVGAANSVGVTVANNQKAIGTTLVVGGIAATGGGGLLAAVGISQFLTAAGGVSSTLGGTALLIHQYFLSN